METPLLNVEEVVAPSLVAEDGDYMPVKGYRAASKVFWLETVKVWKIGAPIAASIMCQFAINSISMIFIGHLGTLELSAASIVISVIVVFSFGFLLGMASALETLCGQAFGAGQVHMLGIYLQRSAIILFVTCIVMLPIYIFASPILKLLGQEDDIADESESFAILTIPRLFSFALYFPTQKFLQAQSKVNVMTWIGLVALVGHVVLCWLLIYVLDWGMTGAAVAYDLSGWGIAIGQAIYTIGWCKEGWHGFSWLAFKDIWAFVRLSIASAVMLCLEVWYTTSLVILTGHLANAVIAIDSLSICMTYNGWVTVLFLGLNAAIGVRVSNELGMGHPRAAKYSVYVTIIECVVIGFLCMAIVLTVRKYLGLLFTSDETLLESVADLAYLLAATMVLGSVQQVISGVAIGGGWQALVAYINIGSYYIFGLPLGYLLAYKANLGVKGLWGGMICGIALQTLLLCFVLYRINWNKEVEQTSERMQKWGGKDIKLDEDDDNTENGT